jgi:hypothetical protein
MDAASEAAAKALYSTVGAEIHCAPPWEGLSDPMREEYRKQAMRVVDAYRGAVEKARDTQLYEYRIALKTLPGPDACVRMPAPSDESGFRRGYAPPDTCQARVVGDEYHCGRCGKFWDIHDEPPGCDDA